MQPTSGVAGVPMRRPVVAQWTAALIADMPAARLSVGVMLDLREAAAQPGASLQMAIQRIEGVWPKSADLGVAKDRPNDAPNVAFMIQPRGHRQVGDVKVPVEEEADCSRVIWGTLGLSGPQQPCQLGGGLLLSPDRPLERRSLPVTGSVPAYTRTRNEPLGSRSM